MNLQTLVSYNNTFGKHTVGALAGYEQEYYREDWTKGYRKNFLNNDLWELNAGSPDGQTADGSANEYALRSFFGRLTYDYDNRYLVEANIRRDGTSRIFNEFFIRNRFIFVTHDFLNFQPFNRFITYISDGSGNMLFGST